METTIDSVVIEIESTAEKSNKNLTELLNLFKELQKTINPMLSSLQSLNKGLESTNSSLKNTNNTMKNSNGMFTKFKSGIGSITKALLGLVGITSLSKFFTDAITQSNEYVENMNLLKVSLRENSDRALEFANNMQRVLGVDSSKIIRYQTTFYNLAEGFGIASEDAYIMSKNLTQLSYDMSSFLNIPVEQAMQKIKSGFSGEIEPMRAVGIALDQATLQETAYRLGIDKSISTMTRAQKTQLLYYQIMTKTQKMQGDMARTLIQPANAIRILKEQFTLLARAVGNIVIPILMKVIPYVMVLTKWLTAAAQTIANLLGFEIDVNGWGDATSYITDGIEDIGDTADGTTKKLKEMLAPFDELNVIDFGDDKTGSDDIGYGGLFDIPTYDYDALKGALTQDLDKVEEKLKKLLPLIASVGAGLLAWRIGDGLGLDGKQKIGLTLMLSSLPFYLSGVKGILDGELTPENFMKAFAGAAGLGVGAGMLTGNWKLALVITTALTFLAGGMALGEKIKEYVPDSIDWYIKEFNLDWDNDKLAEKIGKVALIILGTIGDAIVKFTKEHLPSWLWGGFIAGLEEDDNHQTVADKISESIGKIFEFLNIDNVLPLKILKDIYTSITDTIPKDMEKLKTDVLIPALKNAIKAIADWIEGVPFIGKGIATAIRNGVSSSEDDITTTIENTTTSSMDAARSKIDTTSLNTGYSSGTNYMKGIKDTINNNQGSLTNTIQTTVSNAATNSQNTVGNSGTKIGDKVTENVKNRIGSSQVGITNTLNRTINDASNSTDTSSAGKIGTNISDNISSSIEDSSLKRDLNQVGKEAGEELGDSISDNMEVNNSTLGRTLNSALSGALSRIKWNNWDIFGYGGLLAGLLNFNWTYFADGGFPTEGEAFIARENGPELVGRIGNKSAVANNDQIIAGIAQGVSQGVSEAMGGSQERQPVNVYIGNRKVYSGYGEYANTENNMYGTNVIKV